MRKQKIKNYLKGVFVCLLSSVLLQTSILQNNAIMVQAVEYSNQEIQDMLKSGKINFPQNVSELSDFAYDFWKSMDFGDSSYYGGLDQEEKNKYNFAHLTVSSVENSSDEILDLSSLYHGDKTPVLLYYGQIPEVEQDVAKPGMNYELRVISKENTTTTAMFTFEVEETGKYRVIPNFKDYEFSVPDARIWIYPSDGGNRFYRATIDGLSAGETKIVKQKAMVSEKMEYLMGNIENFADASEKDREYRQIFKELKSPLIYSKYSADAVTIMRAKAVNDYLVDVVNYGDCNSRYYLYGPLIEGKSVCMGYSAAFFELMKNLGEGENCKLVTGNLPFTGLHAWNKVKVNGEWFHVDVTWNDSDMRRPAYWCFMKSDEGISGNGGSISREGVLYEKSTNTVYDLMISKDDWNAYNYSPNGQDIDSTDLVNYVMGKIIDIGMVTYTDECKSKIDSARIAYNVLTLQQKKLVTNYNVLTEAESQYGSFERHRHGWKYTTNGATLIATCNIDDCTETPTVKTLTLTAFGSNGYFGNAEVAIINKNSWEAAGLIVPEIKYAKADGTDLGTTAPSTVGSYKASITQGGVTAEVLFDIVDKNDDYNTTTSAAVKFTVTFKDGEDTISEMNAVEEGNTVKLPLTPTKSRHKFEGWYADDGKQFTGNTKVTSDIIVHAKWIKNSSSSRGASDKSNSSPSSDDRPLAKNSDGKIASSILSKETYANTVVGTDLVKVIGLSEDKVTGLYEINSDHFKGNIAQLSDTVINVDGSKTDKKYIYVKCTKTDKDTLKVDVSSLNTNKELYVYKIDVLGNVEFIKEVDLAKVIADDKFIEVLVANGQNYIISDSKMEEKKAVTEGWNKTGNTWTYIENGKAIKGWKKDTDGKWYYMNYDGAMQVGWQKIDNNWYHFDNSGAMQTGWIKDDGKDYLLYYNGIMVHDTLIYGYRFDSDGVATKI